MYLFFLRAARSQLQAQPPRKIFIHGKPATFNSLKKLITKVFNLLPFNRGCTIEALWNDLQQELFLQVDGWTDVGTNLEQLAEGIWLLQWWDAKFGFLNIYLNRCRTMDDRKLQWCLPENKRSIVPSEELYKSTYQYLLSKTTSRLLSRIG